NTATATADVVGFNLLGGGQGVSADAEILTGANVAARVAASANVTVTGAVLVDSELTGSGNVANAEAHSTGLGLLNAGIFFTKALVGGAVTATLSGSVLSSSSVTVKAIGTNTANADTNAFGLGAFAITGAGVDAEVTSAGDVNAVVGTGTLTTTGAI